MFGIIRHNQVTVLCSNDGHKSLSYVSLVISYMFASIRNCHHWLHTASEIGFKQISPNPNPDSNLQIAWTFHWMWTGLSMIANLDLANRITAYGLGLVGHIHKVAQCRAALVVTICSFTVLVCNQHLTGQLSLLSSMRREMRSTSQEPAELSSEEDNRRAQASVVMHHRPAALCVLYPATGLIAYRMEISIPSSCINLQ